MSNEELLKIILKKILNFFKNDANIEITTDTILKKVDQYTFNEFTSSIQISGDIQQCIILSFSQDLIDKFTDEFVPSGYTSEEINEMVHNIPSEVANNIIGLSLQHLPEGGKNITISPPKVYSTHELKLLSTNSLSNAIQIETISGDIICYVKTK